MTTQDIEQAILEIMIELYEKEYKGKIKVTELKVTNKVIGYQLILGLNRVERPFFLVREGTPEEFLKFVREELRSANFGSMNFYSGYRIEPYEEQQK